MFYKFFDEKMEGTDKEALITQFCTRNAPFTSYMASSFPGVNWKTFLPLFIILHIVIFLEKIADVSRDITHFAAFLRRSYLCYLLLPYLRSPFLPCSNFSFVPYTICSAMRREEFHTKLTSPFTFVLRIVYLPLSFPSSSPLFPFSFLPPFFL